MGSPTLEKVRSYALSLSEGERAELAHSLIASLDGPTTPIRRQRGTLKSSEDWGRSILAHRS